MLVQSGVHLIKFWFSVGRDEQRTRFFAWSTDPVKQWKLSPADLVSLDKWDEYVEVKEAMLFYTDMPHAPWTIVKSNDKKRARLEAMRWVLSQFDSTVKDRRVVGKPDPLLIGSPEKVYDDGEQPMASFPDPDQLSERPKAKLSRCFSGVGYAEAAQPLQTSQVPG